MKELIEQLIRERKEQNKDCKYLVIGKRQFSRLWLKLDLENNIFNITNVLKRKNMHLQGLKVIVVNSDIVEIAGEGEMQ